MFRGTVFFSGGNNGCHLSSPGFLTLCSKILALASFGGGGGGNFSPSSLAVFSGGGEVTVGIADPVGSCADFDFLVDGLSSTSGPNNCSILARTMVEICCSLFTPVVPDHGLILRLTGLPSLPRKSSLGAGLDWMTTFAGRAA